MEYIAEGAEVTQLHAVICELKKTHIQECEHVNSNFLLESQKNARLQYQVELLRNEVEELRGMLKMKEIENKNVEKNEKEMDERDYMNNCYVIECERNYKLQRNIHTLQGEVDELREKLQVKEIKANEENLIENLILRNKIKRKNAQLCKLKEVIDEKELTERSLVDAMKELDEQADEWKEKCKVSELLVKSKQMEINELQKALQDLKVQQLSNVNDLEQPEKKDIDKRFTQCEDKILKEEKSSQGLQLPHIHYAINDAISTKVCPPDMSSASKLPSKAIKMYPKLPIQPKSHHKLGRLNKKIRNKQ